MAQFPIPHLRRQSSAPRCHRDSQHLMIVISVWATFLSAECRSFDCRWCPPLNRHLRLGSATVASDNSYSHLEIYTMHVVCQRSEEHTSELQSLRHLVCR